MKKAVLLPFLLLICAALVSCTVERAEERLLVSVVETEDFTVVKNGVLVLPGESAYFLLEPAKGMQIVSADYGGEYRLRQTEGGTMLELLDIRRPTRVGITLSGAHCRIQYHPNGGGGEAVSIAYDISVHTRPNTSTGMGLFSRGDCTLLGWNTQPDGSGERVGLGSRVTVTEEGLTLYAQWAKWNDASEFTYTEGDKGAVITGWMGDGETVVVPEFLDGQEVTAIAGGAFAKAQVRYVAFPQSLRRIEDGAFSGSAVESILLFDNIESISDSAFDRCGQLKTLYINAAEPPYGYAYRRESVYADKVDLLIESQGREKLVFFGGCSMWYNLDSQAAAAFSERYAVVNMGLNGVVNAYVQMEILGAFLEEGDILFHTPELCSARQLLLALDMDEDDDKLWCGLEYNYDLFTLVDISEINGVFDSLCHYLSLKKADAGYQGQYTDQDGRLYMDEMGCIPFTRETTAASLKDEVFLNPAVLQNSDFSALTNMYAGYCAKGVAVYVSYACVDVDALPEGQRGRENAAESDRVFRGIVEGMDGPVMVSKLEDYLYHNSDFYDTVYHMRSGAARRNTEKWLRDLTAQMERDGLM